jgi:hypothetical protein
MVHGHYGLVIKDPSPPISSISRRSPTGSTVTCAYCRVALSARSAVAGQGDRRAFSRHWLPDRRGRGRHRAPHHSHDLERLIAALVSLKDTWWAIDHDRLHFAAGAAGLAGSSHNAAAVRTWSLSSAL